jgi:hypothetical protein
MEEKRIGTFEEFWPFYVREHSKKSTRILHFIGTTAAVACLATGVLTRRRWMLLVAPVVGYGPAWISHFFIEKNRPASFKYPLWSLKADFVMWKKIVTGQMDEEVERVMREHGEKVAAGETASSETSHAPRDGDASEVSASGGGPVTTPNGSVN